MSFTRRFTAQPGDIDELGHVNNAVWVQWVQTLATDHWQADADPADIARYYWVVVRHEIDYRGNLHPGQSCEARTWVPDPPRGARFDRHVAFTRDGRTLVESKSTWAIVDRTLNRVVRVPAHLVDRFHDR